MKEALLYEKLDNSFVRCNLCNHQCRIAKEEFGACGVRQNRAGTLYSHVYGKLVAANVDPVEKKPLYHFLPGSLSFSIATIGCNFHCGFCQNWQISQASVKKSRLPGEETPPEEVVKLALRNKCKSISYTYTEPTIFFEYAMDVARIAKKEGLYSIFVTNGFMSRQCLEMARPYLDAANVDLKFLSNNSYKKICGGRLEAVLDSIRLMKELGIWVEVTTLVVPGENDSDEELGGIAEFISGIDKDMPWHVSRFHADYKFENYASTPESQLQKAVKIGQDKGLRYTYAGNVGGWGNDTYCRQCNKLLIKREGFEVLENHIQEGKCAYCQAVVPGVFN